MSITGRSISHSLDSLATITTPSNTDYIAAIHCAESRLIVAAESQNEVDQAFSVWKSEFSTHDCNGEVSFFVHDQLVDLDTLDAPDMCGDTVILTMKTDCDHIVSLCSSQFITQPGPQSLNIALPSVDFYCYSGTSIPDFEKLVPLYSPPHVLAFGIPSPCIDLGDLQMTIERQGPIIEGNEVTEIRIYHFLFLDGNSEIASQSLSIYWPDRCIDNQNITLYPNPFQEIFQIEFISHETDQAEILIFDRLGKLVHNHSIETNRGLNKKEVNLKNLPTGTYMVEIRMGQSTEQKLIIKTQ